MTMTRTERQKIFEEGRTAAILGRGVATSGYLEHEGERQEIWLEGYRLALRQPNAIPVKFPNETI